MKKNLVLCAIATLLFALGALSALAQLTQVEGTVTDGGKPLAGALVTFTNLDNNRTFKNIKTDKSGKFSTIGIPIGNYNIEVSSSSGEKLYQQKSSVAPNETGLAVLKIDISETKPGGGQAQPAQPSQPGQTGEGTGKQQQQKYTKEQIEEIKKQNEKAVSTNALVKQVNEAVNTKNWEAAVAPLQQLIAADPNNWQYYSGLGDAQYNLGQYDQAVATFDKGIQIADSNTTVDPKNPSTDPAKKKAGVAKMLTNEGNSYLKLKKNKEAVDAYTKAASMDPNPGVAYFNLCATQYNTGNIEGALDACDKAIAADPNKADAYFIKGSLMIASSKTDPSGKVTAPPGTAEALNKYLELAPNGAHAADVKQMLEYIGSKVETTYKKRGK